MPTKYFKNTIWTTHALQRLADRRLTQAMAWKAFAYPHHHELRSDGTTEFRRRFGIYEVTVIAKQDAKGNWLVISCWLYPPLPGTADASKRLRYFRYKNGSLLTKLWLRFKKIAFGQNF